MKKILMALGVLAALAGTQTVEAAVRVRGYVRQNGTYVQPHYRSDPDRSRSNNWSTYPNVNPYTGQTGRRQVAPRQVFQNSFRMPNEPRMPSLTDDYQPRTNWGTQDSDDSFKSELGDF